MENRLSAQDALKITSSVRITLLYQLIKDAANKGDSFIILDKDCTDLDSKTMSILESNDGYIIERTHEGWKISWEREKLF
jgi:hypothetical protein